MGADSPTAIPSARLDTFPTSYAQQRLWLLEQVLTTGAVYNASHTLRLKGVLEVSALERALAEVVQRHESLRTHFALVDGAPMQVVTSRLSVRLAAEEVAGEAQAFVMAQAEAQRGFDLARGPLWRARLLRLSADEHWLQLTLHHIVTDGWSTQVLMRELSQLYAAYRAGEASPLAPLPVQYADYAVWQRQWLEGAVLARQLAYWREALAELPVLELPTDRRRPVVSSYRGGRVAFVLPAALTSALKALGRREGATLFMTLLAAYQVLLSRYSGQDDVAVGVASAGRSRPEVEGLIGFFVNMLVLRGDLSGAPSFSVYLARVRERALAAYAHQDIPFEKLVEELAPKRDLSRNPLFQVSLVLHNMPASEWALPGLTVARVEGVSSERAKFDLTLSLGERAGELHGAFEYAEDLFDAATIERMARHWRVLLEAVVVTPEVSIARLPLLEAAERAQLLAQAMGPAVPLPTRCVHELFAAQAQRTPQALAVVQGGRQLTYGELDARANQLAQHLRTLGVGPDVLVALCAERSLELVVGMLGILKAGGAYVPLDPGYPAERLALMLEDTQAPVLLTQAALLGQLPRFGGEVICLERDAARWATRPCLPPPGSSAPGDLAYVIYTSGSAGTPKGVMVSHASVASLVCGANYVSLSPADTVAHCSSVAFDAATFEVWGALLNGARLAILARDDILSARALTRVIDVHGITCMFLTTALFNEISRANPHAFQRLRYLLFGGEVHDPGRSLDVLDGSPPEHLVHVYGPTETTTFATFHEVCREDVANIIPIGRPISGAVVLILDEAGSVVPPGIVGELHIGGRGVARGYLHRPDETAERFVAHPISASEQDFVFKTGDLGRWNAAGSIEFVGRRDEQVKIRGFRIEPAETAATVSRHPSVRACYVTTRRQPSGDVGLTVYFVPAPDKPPLTTPELQRYVAGQLPTFMVPVSCIAVDALPLTTNGKVDHRALPDPAQHQPLLATAKERPRDHVERVLWRIWGEELGVAQIGIDDDFFAMGGHSLLAARVFSRIDGELTCSLPLGVLFECPTIRRLAERLRQGRYSACKSVVPIAPGGSLPPLYIVPGVFGNVVGFADLARAFGPDQPLYGLQSAGLDGNEAPLTTIEAMARQYVEEIRRVQRVGPYAFAGACFGASVAYEMARQVMAQGETVAYLGLLDPSQREGKRANARGSSFLRGIYGIDAFSKLVLDRIRLYRSEMSEAGGAGRILYIVRKVRLMARRLHTLHGGDLRRELNARAVYQCNVAALDHYHRAPLLGDLRLLAIIETAGDGPTSRRRTDTWSSAWSGQVVREVVPGRDSGDMLSKAHAGYLAELMIGHLRTGFESSISTQNSRAERDRTVTA